MKEYKLRNPRFGSVSLGASFLYVALFWAATANPAKAQSLTPTATPDPTPTCPAGSGPRPTIEVNILPYRSTSPSSSADNTPIPTPTWWPTRTDCPIPTPTFDPNQTPTPTCVFPDYYGFFYRTEQEPFSVENGQPFRIAIERFRQNWCGSMRLDSEIVYTSDVLRLTTTYPGITDYYEGTVSLDFEAIDGGEAQIGVRYQTNPPVLVGLTNVTVIETSPTATFTPIPTPSVSPTPSVTWGTPPPPTCTPALAGPFYSCASNCDNPVVEVGKVLSVLLYVRIDDCMCCIDSTNPTFYFDESIFRLLSRRQLTACRQEEWTFQALRPGSTILSVNYRYWSTNYTDDLTTMRAIPTPLPDAWMLR